MIPILYKSTEKNFNHNGIGFLRDTIFCNVTEERNGLYELELIYPVGSFLLEEITKQRIIKAKSNDRYDPQLFRIYYISKPLDGQIKVKAEHISYDNKRNFIEKVNFSGNCGGALSALKTNASYQCPFNFLSDLNTSNQFSVERVNILNAIVGANGSIMDTYGDDSDIVRDNFNLSIKKEGGLDKNVLISYRKNITGFECEDDDSEVITQIYPFAKVDEEIITLPEKFISSEYLSKFPDPIICEVDLSSNDVTDVDSLREKANNYFKSTKRDIPKFNYKIDFISLSKTENYKDLKLAEDIGICDYVIVRHESYNINEKHKVIKTIYDTLAEKYESIELGEPKTDLNTIIGNMNNDIKDEINKDKITPGFLDQAIENLTNAITGNDGGYVRLNPPKNPSEILVLDHEDINQARIVWRWNKAGLGVSNSGYNGNFIGLTRDGKLVIDEATANKINAALIEAGTITANHLSVTAKEELKNGLVTIANFEVALNNIKLEVSENYASKTSVDNLSKSLEEAKKNLKGEISDVSSNLNNLEENINGSFKDGIINEAETIAIHEQIRQLDKEKLDIDKKYDAIYANTELKGTVKINLEAAKTNYINAHSSLKTIINNAISDKIITPEENINVNNKFSDYNQKLSEFSKVLEQAIDAIGSEKVKKLETSTNDKISKIEVNTDGIKQTVSNVQNTVTTHTTQLGAVDGKINTAKNQAITDSRKILDTRNTNENPSWYFSNYPRQTIVEFKNSDIIEIPGGRVYGTMTTSIPWSDSSGGYPVQTFRSNGKPTYERKGTSNTAWGSWLQLEDITGSQNKATQALNDSKGYTNTQITSVNTTMNNKFSEIKQTTDAINLEVNNTKEEVNNVNVKVEGIQIGGRNLARNTKFEITSGYRVDLPLIETEIKKLKNKKVTISLDVDIINAVSSTNDGRIGAEFSIIYSDDTTHYIGIWEGIGNTNKTLKKRLCTTITINDKEIKSINPLGVYIQRTTGGTFRLGYPKVEAGNKATDWTPAPEDVSKEILDVTTEKVNEAKADIKITTDSITQSVSNVQSTVTTHTSQLGAVDGKINTAKNEAINTASSDATTKANNAKTQALNDSKGYTNSQITTVNSTMSNKFAEIKATTDSITQKVNSTESKVNTVTTTANNALNSANSAKEIALAMQSGKILYKDPTFKEGFNDVKIYNNTGDSKVTINRITKLSDCPTSSTHCLEIKSVGSVNPGLGGFYFGTKARENAIYIVRFIAKLESGRALNFATNAVGDGSTSKWLSDNKGTGKWVEYIYKINCGHGGSFSSTVFFYVSGGNTPTTSSPLVWHLGYATVFDITDSEINYDGELSKHTTQISQVTQKAALLETNLNSITGRVSSVETKTNTIDGKVTSQETRLAETEQKITTDGIFNTVKNKFETISSDNLIQNSLGRLGHKYWNIYKHHGQGNVTNKINNSIDNSRDGLQFTVRDHINTRGGLLSYSIPVKENTKYTLSGKMITHRGDSVYIELMCWDKIVDEAIINPNVQKIHIGIMQDSQNSSFTFTTPSGTRFINIYLWGEYLHYSSTWNYAHYWIKELRLNEGELSHPWCESNTFSESNIAQTSNEISMKVSSSEFNNLNSDFTQYKQDTNSFKWGVKTGLGENLVKNSGFRKGDLDWWWIHEHNPSGNNKKITVNDDSSSWILDSTKACVIRSTNIPTDSEYSIRQTIKVKKNTTYTLSFLCAHHRCIKIGCVIREKNSRWLTSALFTANEIGEGGKDPSRWKKVIKTFNTGENDEIGVQLGVFQSGNDSYFWVTDICLIEGEIENAWHPNSEEAYGSSMKFDTKGLQVNFNNGTYSLLSNQGNKYYDGSDGREYHALSETGYTVVGGYNDVIPDEVWVQLPNAFKGKKFTVAISLQETMGGHQDSEWVQKIKMEVKQFDYSRGKFLLKGDWWSRTTANHIYRKEVGIRWIALA